MAALHSCNAVPALAFFCEDGEDSEARHCAPPNGKRLSMQTYQLKFPNAQDGEADVIEFEADDAARALIVAHKKSSRRSAELWRDEQRLCTIKRTAPELE